MLRFIDAGLSQMEVPDETRLCIYISGCMNHCNNCHYPELQYADYGDILYKSIYDLVEIYLYFITCVCFLGEGGNSEEDRRELIKYSDYVHAKGLKSCLYSGRNTYIEDWMKTFDYVKVGAFDMEKGALTEETTNQVMVQKNVNGYQDITDKFWKEE